MKLTNTQTTALGVVFASVLIIFMNRFYAPEVSLPSITSIFESQKQTIEIEAKVNIDSQKHYAVDQLKCDAYDILGNEVSVHEQGKDSAVEYQTYIGYVNELLQHAFEIKQKQQALNYMKPAQIKKVNIDFSEASKTYLQLLKKNEVIEAKNEYLKAMLKANSNSNKWEISVENYMLDYLNKRKEYLTLLLNKNKNRQRPLVIPRQLDSVDNDLTQHEATLWSATLKKEEMTNYKVYEGQLRRLENEIEFYELRKQEIDRCLNTKSSRQEHIIEYQIYQELEKLKEEQSKNRNQKYCMDLKEHLVQKLVKEFKFLQSTFRCAKEKPKVEQELFDTRRKLNEKRNQKNQFETYIVEMERKLQSEKSKLNSDAKIVHDFMDKLVISYNHTVIVQLLEYINHEIQDHTQRLQKLTNQKKQELNDPSASITLLRDVNLLKLDYCNTLTKYNDIISKIKQQLRQAEQERRVEEMKSKEYAKILQQIETRVSTINKIKQKFNSI